MPQSHGNASQRKGRWRQGEWKLVQKKNQPNRQPTYKNWGAPKPSGTGGHSSYAAAAASANHSAGTKQQQWTTAEWNDWIYGGWRAGLGGQQSADRTVHISVPRDEERDATTASIREELQEVQALRALNARSKNPCPVTTKHLDERAAALRVRLDGNKLPTDLYHLDRKKLLQLQDRAAKLQEQSTKSWAEIGEAVEAAKQRDQRYLSVMAQIEELESSIPARALAAGVEPPKPELDSAVEALQKQVEKTTSTDAASDGPLAETMRAAMRQIQELLAQAQQLKAEATSTPTMAVDGTQANDLRADTQRPPQMDVDGTGNSTPDVAQTNAPASTTRADTLAPTATTPTTTTTSAEGAASTPATVVDATVPTAAATVPAAMDTSTAESNAILQRAQEAATIRGGDPEPVAKARSALRARLLQQPNDTTWLRMGTRIVEDEVAKQTAPLPGGVSASSALRPRSRSRSGGTAGDADVADEDEL